MKKDEVQKFIEEKGDTSYVIRTEDDDKKFLENYGKSVLEKELDPAISKIHTQYDDDLFELFGERKKPGEKTYKFMKDKVKSIKEKAERVDTLETEIEALKKGSPEVEAKLREIKSLQGQMDKLKKDYEDRITDMAKQNLRNNVKAEIERGLLGIQIKSGIPESMKQMFIDNTINDLASKAEIRDGKIVFLDDEGKALRDPSTMAPYAADALLKERMKDIIETGRKKPGVDIVDKVEKTKDGKVNVVIPSDIESREKLGDYLVSLGIKRNTKEFMEAYKEYGTNLRPFENSK